MTAPESDPRKEPLRAVRKRYLFGRRVASASSSEWVVLGATAVLLLVLYV